MRWGRTRKIPLVGSSPPPCILIPLVFLPCTKLVPKGSQGPFSAFVSSKKFQFLSQEITEMVQELESPSPWLRRASPVSLPAAAPFPSAARADLSAALSALAYSLTTAPGGQGHGTWSPQCATKSLVQSQTRFSLAPHTKCFFHKAPVLAARAQAKVLDSTSRMWPQVTVLGWVKRLW